MIALDATNTICIMWLMKLKTYLEDNKIRIDDFALNVGVTADAVRKWIRGERRPKVEKCADIERATNGNIVFYDFYPMVASQHPPPN